MVYTEELLRFNTQRDLFPVDQSGFVDLVQAWDNRVIPGDLSNVELTEEPCEDTEACFSKPRDIFDVMQQHHTIRENLDAKNSKTEGQS